MSFSTLDDLPEILPQLSVMSVHGLGRGGGERVAVEIDAIYRARGGTISVLPSRSITFTGLKRHSGSTHEPILLLAAGPRDLPAAIKALLAGVAYAVYYQLPYIDGITW